LSTDDCRQCRETAPELALGIASGDERAAALRHLASCPSCRAEVRELTEAAETLLLAAREAEPSAGFDERVAAAMTPPARAGWTRRSWMTAAAAAVVVALVAGGVIGWLIGRPDGPARDYAAAVEAADGRSLRVAGLGVDDGVSRVVAFDGDPSWLLVTIAGGIADGEYEIVCEYEGGWSVTPGTVTVEGGQGTWAATIPRTLADLTGVQLRAPDGREAGHALFG
jgi:hypothetical protein